METRAEDLLEIGQSRSPAELKKRLVALARRAEFDLISAVLMRGEFDDPDVVVRSVSNTPAAFAETSQSLDQARRDPVMMRLMRTAAPVLYDKQLYVDAGAADVWETQAPFGYCTGVAVALHLPKRRHFLFGVDRPADLPLSPVQLTKLVSTLQVAAVHAQYAATQMFDSALDANIREAPHLTPRELEILRWTMEGKSSSVIGEILNISYSAVRFHIRNLSRKLDVNSKHQAVLKAISLGLL
jgi:DNA-binding CsgD family transcriptional regulator